MYGNGIIALLTGAAALAMVQCCPAPITGKVIGPGESANLSLMGFADGYSLVVRFDDPTGTLHIQDLDASSSTLMATDLMFDPSGDGSYWMDAFYLGADGMLYDIGSLFDPPLNLAGQLGGGTAASDEWISEHTHIGGGKVIWSFSDGTVITIDHDPATVEVNTRDGDFTTAAPEPAMGRPASIHIQNETSGNVSVKIVRKRVTPAPLALAAGLLLPDYGAPSKPTPFH